MTSTLRHCLLVIDDEPAVCDSVHDLLRREFRVLKATSALDGCRLLQEEEIHIVMTDQRMPQVTGVELLAKIKAKNPRAIRMLFTGFADLESIIAAINQGHVYQFIKKPWRPEELQDAVRMAATEYDRIVAASDDTSALLGELEQMRQRISALEAEVGRLGGLIPVS
jgi:response regulator RpfG family c-di-GMP phosphodiesterase